MTAATPHSDGHLDTASLSLRLLTVVRAIARENRTEAMMRFGLDEAVLDALKSADVVVLEEMSLTGKLLFKPMFGVSDVHAAALRSGVVKPVAGRVTPK